MSDEINIVDRVASLERRVGEQGEKIAALEVYRKGADLAAEAQAKAIAALEKKLTSDIGYTMQDAVDGDVKLARSIAALEQKAQQEHESIEEAHEVQAQHGEWLAEHEERLHEQQKAQGGEQDVDAILKAHGDGQVSAVEDCIRSLRDEGYDMAADHLESEFGVAPIEAADRAGSAPAGSEHGPAGAVKAHSPATPGQSGAAATPREGERTCGTCQYVCKCDQACPSWEPAPSASEAEPGPGVIEVAEAYGDTAARSQAEAYLASFPDSSGSKPTPQASEEAGCTYCHHPTCNVASRTNRIGSPGCVCEVVNKHMAAQDRSRIASEAREKAMRECAQIADDEAGQLGTDWWNCAKTIASAIRVRALSPSTSEGGEKHRPTPAEIEASVTEGVKHG